VQGEVESRDHGHLTELESHGDRLASELSEVIFIAFANLLDDTMDPQTCQQACDLAGVLVWEVAAQLLVGETADEELALQQGAEQTGISSEKRLKPL